MHDAEWPPRFETILRRHLPLAENAAIDPTEPLYELGLDSMGIMRLMMEIEDAVATEFPEDLVSVETFCSARLLWRAVSGIGSWE